MNMEVVHFPHSISRLSTPTEMSKACISDCWKVVPWLVVTRLVMVVLGFVRSTALLCNRVLGAPRESEALSKDPVKIPSAILDDLDLVAGVGTVARNVHWILFPVTFPLTLFTGNSCLISWPLLRTVEKNFTAPLLFAQT